MIIYGIKATHLLTDTIIENCPSCGKPNVVQLSLFQRYAHIFWIPFFPADKTGVSACTHCKQVLKLKEMPPSFRMAYQNLKSQAKLPLWTFSGLGLVAIGILVSVYYNHKKGNRNAQWIQSPVKGDVYEVRVPKDSFTLMRVDKIVGDTVFTVYNKYQTSTIQDLDKIKADTAFLTSEVHSLSKAELKKMLANDDIIDIDR